LLALTGCGRSDFVQLQGKVTLDGKPLHSGVVTFHNKSDGPSGYGQVQPDGTYSARTGSQPGLRPGKYVATVTAFAAPAPSKAFEEKASASIVPARYSDPETSGFSYTLSDSGGKYDLELKKN
jgi:hypothetical protein